MHQAFYVRAIYELRWELFRVVRHSMHQAFYTRAIYELRWELLRVVRHSMYQAFYTRAFNVISRCVPKRKVVGQNDPQRSLG